ncbi:MAG: tetratricopeptide repeat protein, partial [Acidimicrobiia bacterium]
LIPENPPTPERAGAEAQLGRLLMLTGIEGERATAITRKALRTAEAAGDPFTETAALVTLGVLELDPAEGEVVLRKGLEMATAQNAVFQITRARTNLSEMLAGQGRHEEAVELMREGLELVRRFGAQGQSESWMVANLADRYHDAGRWPEALEVLEFTVAPGYPEAVKIGLQARIFANQGRFEEARELFRREDEEYGHITDIQVQSPLAAGRIWLARWTGDTSMLSSEMFALRDEARMSASAEGDATEYLLAASEAAAWGQQNGQPLVGTDEFDRWMATADRLAVEYLGDAMRAMLVAQRARFDGVDDPRLWVEAVRAWPSDTFEQAVAVLGWVRSSLEIDSEIRAAAQAALATADRLGAEPLRAELEGLLDG